MKKIYLMLFVVLTTACSTQHKSVTTTVPQSNLIVDGKLYTSAFQQSAAEYKALCLQAYNIARLRLDEALKQTSVKRKAIITDIDETVLDNSRYAVKRALEGKTYDQASWSDWTARGIADTMPGALSFFQYVASQGIEIFYITNRLEEEREGTLKNLQLYGFPVADHDHLLMKVDASSKESRRQKIAENHDIVLLLGDNLADFSSLFDDKKPLMERNNIVLQTAAEYGKRFIVLPNSNYGDWEGALYKYQSGMTPAQKDSALKSNLKGY